MFRLLFLALSVAVATSATGASAEPPPGSRIDPAPGSLAPMETIDQAAARQAMRTFAGCVARARRRWAESALTLPFLSSEQNDYVRRGFGGFDDCMGYSGLELRFYPPSMVGGMAEELIATRYRSAGLDPIVQLTDESLESRGLVPRNVNEDFGLCVVRRDPALVREFLATRPAASEERTGAGRLAPHLGACLYQGQTLDFRLPALRALLAPALYRALTALAAPQARN